MRNLLKSIVVLVMFSFSVLSAEAQNLITNGGFEDGINNWNTAISGGSIATIQPIQTDVYEGSNALEIDVSSSGLNPGDISIVKTGFAVQKDIVYILTFWAKADSTDRKADVLFSSTLTTSNKPYDSSKVYFSTDWKKYEVVFPSPVTTTSDIQFSFRFGTTKGTILLDEVSIEKKGNSWYEGAEYRIDKYRKGDFGVKILNLGGQPISDTIIIRQKKHEFPWGTSIDINDRPTGSNYTTMNDVTAPADSELYKIERYGQFITYNFPAVKGNTYKLTIKMAEIYFTEAGKRFFDVFVDGVRVIENIDKYAVAKATYKACDSTITITAIDTVIRIEFISKLDNAAINGLVLSDELDNPILKLCCRPSTLVTHDGNTYTSDLPYIDTYAPSPNTTNDDFYKSTLLKYCNYGVCGNQFKWSGIEPNQGVINYAPFDNTNGWFHKVGWDMRAHTLLWGGTSSTDYHELPKWVGELPPSVMYDTCKLRIQREMTHYKGIIKEYDVMNEPLHAKYLQSQVGDSINWNCFKWAREADPDARLFINDYNIIEYQNDCDNFVTLMSTLLKNDAPIDGIGAQSHFGTTIDVPSVKSRLDQLSQFGIPIKITEFDMGAVSMTQQEHAIQFAKMMRLSFSYPNIEGFVIWSLFDPGWRPSVANLFETDKTPKIVADTVYNLIHERWKTNLNEETDTSGICLYRGFYGDYEVMVKFGDTWEKFDISCTKENEGKVFILNENDSKPTNPVLKQVRIETPLNVELTFDKEMVDPAAEFKYFKVHDTLTNSVQSAALKSGDPTTIILTMKSALKTGYYTSVSYYPGNVKSADGGKLELFGPEVDNRYTPSFIAAYTTKNGKTLSLNFKDSIDLASAKAEDFSVKVNNTLNSVSGFKISNNNDSLYLNLTKQIVSATDIVTISYKPGTLITSNDLKVNAFIDKTVNNNVVVPNFVSALTTDDGGIIQLRFSRPIEAGSINISDFTVTINNTPATIKLAELLSTNKQCVELTLTNPVQKNATVLFTYTPGSLKSVDDVPVAPLSKEVTNNVTSGVDEISLVNSLKLYPNPVTDILFISDAAKYQTISITNITGQEIFKAEIPVSGNIEVNTKSFSQGLYFVVLKNDLEKITHKIIKR